MSNEPDIDVEARAEAAEEVVSPDDSRFLESLGGRVRELRERRGMSRKFLAREAQVSERYLGHLEAGSGNISVMLLPEEEDSVERRLIRRFLERLPRHRMEEVIFRLMRDFGAEEALRRKRVALIGLRGAGKSTLGPRLAKQMQVPLIELNGEVMRETGLPINEVIALSGPAAYRRIERRALERVLREHARAVIVAGGGIVADEEAFRLLLANCYTAWLKAKPEEHMARVLAQGDLRPMAGNDEAMEDLKRILASREALYGQADAIVDTSGETPDESFATCCGDPGLP